MPTSARKCRYCKKYTKLSNPEIIITPRAFLCSDKCLHSWIKENKQKMLNLDSRTRKREMVSLDRRHQTRLTQKAFNRFIRILDTGQPCISCGVIGPTESQHGYPIGWDCGHFKSVGSHPELRFVTINAFRQCKRCNGGSGKFARSRRTVDEGYRHGIYKVLDKELADKIIHESGNLPARKYTGPELKQIRSEINFYIKELSLMISDGKLDEIRRKWRNPPLDMWYSDISELGKINRNRY